MFIPQQVAEPWSYACEPTKAFINKPNNLVTKRPHLVPQIKSCLPEQMSWSSDPKNLKRWFYGGRVFAEISKVKLIEPALILSSFSSGIRQKGGKYGDKHAQGKKDIKMKEHQQGWADGLAHFKKPEFRGVRLESQHWGGKRGQGSPGICWPAHLAYLASSKSVKDPVLPTYPKKVGDTRKAIP